MKFGKLFRIIQKITLKRKIRNFFLERVFDSCAKIFLEFLESVLTDHPGVTEPFSVRFDTGLFSSSQKIHKNQVRDFGTNQK